jgi:hypothetical protein
MLKLTDILNEAVNNIEKFLSNKTPVNSKMGGKFLYHATKISPEKFKLRGAYDWEDSNAWLDELPEGYVFLTTDVKEASAYGKWIIPCELKKTDHLFFKVNSPSPSRVFDDDFNGRLNLNMWDQFEDSNKTNLIIKGSGRWTIISPYNNVNPRIDLAKEFYFSKDK